ncbi:MAG TPA: DUF3857 domain-containing protein, partial [Puia sp.]|nr:DUF3857 domain-containing protein [Puia sp.]
MRIALSTILLSCLTLHALSDPAARIGASPAWLLPVHPDQTRQPLPADISNGFYYDLQDRQTNLPLETEYTHFIRHIVNASGVQEGSEVSVTFSPQYQRVVFHRITILRDGAALDQLQPSRIKVVQEEADAGDYEYTGLKRAYLTLPDVRKGDRIDIAWSVIGFNPVFGSKYAARQYFTRPTAICNYFRTIISSPGRPLRFVARNHAPVPAEQMTNGNLIYHWDNPPLVNDDDGAEAPSWYDATPYVCVTEYKDWQAVADWGLATFNHYRFDLPPALLAKIAEWRKTAGDNKDLLANLATRFVQN